MIWNKFKRSLSVSAINAGFIILFIINATCKFPENDNNEEIEPIKAPFKMTQLQRPVFSDKTFDIRDYGAIGDGVTKSTEAFQKAITDCNAEGGGKVVVPAGKWYTGAIHLKSNVNLYLEEGAELHFSESPEDYLPVAFTRWAGFEVMNYSPLIYAIDCENIAITGSGSLYGHGESWWNWSKLQNSTGLQIQDMVLQGVAPGHRVFGKPENGLRPQFINPVRCRNVLLEGFTIAQPGPFWTIQILYCEKVIVRKLKVQTKGGPNTDGINIDSSREVLVEHCVLETGDDAVCIKSGINEDGWRVDRPAENIVVRHITTNGSVHGGIVIGSEISGGVRNLMVHDCFYNGASIGIRLKSNSSRGGVIENLWFKDIKMKDILREAISINTDYSAWMSGKNGMKHTVFRNIKVRNINCDGAGIATYVNGKEEQAVEKLLFKNVFIKAKKGMTFNWVNHLSLKNVKSEPDTGEQIIIKNCTNVNH